ncbi:MAG TPA: biotin--[acetyl-CoA-carboxylase] ligase [Stellaceae bacterium]|jgi:BirA family biotin operon repressor/biotin-[acetyl-CoA-carboxylase] ligase|nr:biotin--[acetyl-CoA-carboxylase] ligase [Stellaceae bacterium]
MSDAALALPSGYHLHAFAAVGSTNDEAKALARAGAPPGTLVWAREQTGGRGRRGRVWQSPPGNLYLSLVLRPDQPPAITAQLGFVAAVALGVALRVLTPLADRLRFKWPNDLLLDGCKIAGILLESEIAASDRVDFVVIGIGVNIASAPSGVEYPAISLAAVGAAIDPEDLLPEFTRQFDRWERCWQQEGFGPVRAAWLDGAGGLGDGIRVRLERSTLYGRFCDLDQDGALVLEAAEGRRRIAAGEIFLAAG